MSQRQRGYNDDIAVRHVRRRKKRKRLTALGRIVVFLLFLLIAGVIVAFFTPTFNIKAINVEGNTKVDSQTIISQTGIVEGQNLFKINISQIKRSIETIAYIDEIDVDRKLFPPSVNIIVTEAKPNAYVKIDGKYILIDKKCKVLEECDSLTGVIPEIVGLNLRNYTVGSKLVIDESEKSDIILLCIDKIDELGLTRDINSINVEDVSNISFKYQNRLTVICGSSLDMDYKLAFFDNIIKSDKLQDNSRGTLDLSTKGRTVYTP